MKQKIGFEVDTGSDDCGLDANVIRLVLEERWQGCEFTKITVTKV